MSELDTFLNIEGQKIVNDVRALMVPGHGYRTGNWQRSVNYEVISREVLSSLNIYWTAEYGDYVDRHYDYEFSQKSDEEINSYEFEEKLLEAIDKDIQVMIDAQIKNSY